MNFASAFRHCLLSLCLMVIALPVTSQAAATADPVLAAQAAAALTQQDIEQASLALARSDSLNEEQKKPLGQQLEKAGNWINEALKEQQTHQRLNQEIAGFEARQKELTAGQKILVERLANLEKTDAEKRSASELTAALSEINSQLDATQQQLLRWERTLSELLPLASEGAGRFTQLESTLAQLQESAAHNEAAPPADISLRIQQLSLNARVQALKANLQLLGYKMGNLGRLTESAQSERDYWFLKKTVLLKQAAQLQAKLQTLKAAEAEADLQKTLQQEIAADHPLYPLYSQIIALQQEKNELILQEKSIAQQINQGNEAIATLKTHFSRDKQIVALEGSRETIAQVLHKRLETLGAFTFKPRDWLKTKNLINEAVLKQLLLNEKLNDINRQTPEALTRSLLDEQALAMSADEQQHLSQATAKLVADYVQTAKELQSLYPAYISKLSELNTVFSQQQEQLSQYRRFLNDHLLWLPNATLGDLLNAQALTSSLAGLTSLNSLGLLAADVRQVLHTHPERVFLWIVLFALLLTLRQRIVVALGQVASRTTSIRTDAYRYTLQAGFYTLLLSLPLPWLLFGGALLLNLADAPAEFTHNLSQGLADAGLLILLLALLKQTCRADGLAERHFRWHNSVRHTLVQELRWAMPFGAILILLIDLSANANSAAETQLIGRLAFITLMVGMIVLGYRLWSSRSEIMQDFSHTAKTQAWLQLHFLWFPLLLAFPLFLIWATAAGYYYSALVIAERFHWMIGLVLVIYIVREFFLRSLYLSERKQHYAERLQKRQAQLAQQSNTAETNALPELTEEPEIDYEKLSKQVRQALNLVFILAFLSGIWFIWQDVLPALNLINDSTLSLTKSQVVDGVVQQVPLTLGDLVWGVALGAMTLLLAKNLPGLLEFMLLKHLPISAAARYAITTLTQYIIAIIGLIMIFRALGIEWSNIQWLVAALSVGLGFGLQEIVANFVSGIILLFEQPIRVGDIVTVNEVSGKVSRIRIRATTIVNWDRQELVIPNKQIITGQFINWSLSDQVTRIRVDVGVAYGSDVVKALKLIKEAALNHPKVLKEPEPFVVFEAFGDNSLQLSLRAFVEDLDNFILIRSELHSAINEALKQAQIVIAFPQRDVHLDTSQPLEIRLSKAAKESSANT